MHFGGQLAAPVFKEIVTGIYSQYIRGKNGNSVQVPLDSSSYVYAGTTADVKEVLTELKMPYTDSVDKKATLSEVHSYNYKPVAKAVTDDATLMPDVRYMTLKDALYILENKKLKVIVKGRGKVMVQDILPGTPLTKNTTVTILLN